MRVTRIKDSENHVDQFRAEMQDRLVPISAPDSREPHGSDKAEAENLGGTLLALLESPQDEMLQCNAKSLIESVDPAALVQELAQLNTQVKKQIIKQKVSGFWILYILIDKFPTDAGIQELLLSAISRSTSAAWETAVQSNSTRTLDAHFSALIIDFIDKVFNKKEPLKSSSTPLSLLFSSLSDDSNSFILHQLLLIASRVIGCQILEKMITVKKKNSVPVTQSVLMCFIDILNQAFEAKTTLCPELISDVYTLMEGYFQKMRDHAFEPIDGPLTSFATIVFLIRHMNDNRSFSLAKLVIQKTCICDLKNVYESLVQAQKDPVVRCAKNAELLALTESIMSTYFESLTRPCDPALLLSDEGVCERFTLFERYPQHTAMQMSVTQVLDGVPLSRLTVSFKSGRAKGKTPLVILIDVLKRHPEDVGARTLASKVANQASSRAWTINISPHGHHTLDDFLALFMLEFLHVAHKDLTKVMPESPFACLLYMLEQYPDSQLALDQLTRAKDCVPPEVVGEMIGYEEKKAGKKGAKKPTVNRSVVKHLTQILSTALKTSGPNLAQVIDGIVTLFSRYFKTLKPHAWEVFALNESDTPKQLFELLVVHLSHNFLFSFAQKVILYLPLKVLPSLHESLQSKKTGPQAKQVQALTALIERESPEIQRRIRLAEKKVVEEKLAAERAAKAAAKKKADAEITAENIARKTLSVEETDTRRSLEKMKAGDKNKIELAQREVQRQAIVAQSETARERVSGTEEAERVTLLNTERKASEMLLLSTKEKEMASELAENVIEMALLSSEEGATREFVENMQSEDQVTMAAYFSLLTDLARNKDMLSNEFWAKKQADAASGTTRFPLAKLVICLWFQPDNPVFLELLEIAVSHAGPMTWCQTWLEGEVGKQNTWSPTTLLVDKVFWEWGVASQTLLAPILQIMSQFRQDTWPQGLRYQDREIDSPLRILATLFWYMPDRADLLSALVDAMVNAPESAWRAVGVDEWSESSAVSILNELFNETEAQPYLAQLDQVQLMELKIFTSQLSLPRVSVNVSSFHWNDGAEPASVAGDQAVAVYSNVLTV